MKRLLLVPAIVLSFLQSPTFAGAGNEPATARRPSGDGFARPAPTAPATPSSDRTLSPYFFVKSDDPSVDQLPLKATRAEVDIVGVIARVKVTQVYRNEGKRPLEAIYIFPGSTRAAVHGMKMTIGDRVITARIEERQQARRQYEEARQAGRTASLLEQQRPNVFQMNVANILPGDEIKVELVYTEMLVPEKGIYEFVYPTVVGPRYTRAQADTATQTGKWVQNPYLHQGEPPTATFDFKARIAAGMPLKEVVSPSHEVKIDFPADWHPSAAAALGTPPLRATVSLDSADKLGGNRDLVLRYRLADDRIETGLLLSEGAGENFFLCLVEPPRRFASTSVPPREYVFIMDVSGSMNGFPVETSKELLRNVLGKLRPADYFNVLFFSGGNYVLSPNSLEATEANKAYALQEIERQRGGGGTELLPALERAFNLPRARMEISRVIVIATDGYVDVEREAFTLIREHLSDANVFTFGIGRSVNRYLLEGMARVGEGTPFVVLDPGEAQGAAARFLQYIESPLLTRVEVRVSGFEAYDLEPASVPDLFAERPLVLVGKYRGEPSGAITVTGFTGQGRFERRMNMSKNLVSPGNDAIKYLWARERVALLSDFAAVRGTGSDSRQEVIALGLKYNLLTEFTSFVAIDQHVRRQDGQLETVKQPLPLPQGVSDLAVGGARGVGESVIVRAAAPMVAAREAADMLELRPAARPLAWSPSGVRTGASVRIEVSENHLQSRTRIAEIRLKEIVARSLAATNVCFAGAAIRDPRRVKISFDGKGRVSRVEILEEERWKDAPEFVACLRAAIQNGLVLPWPAGGYLVVAISPR
jgi:Ca-activated chloride channel family protein